MANLSYSAMTSTLSLLLMLLPLAAMASSAFPVEENAHILLELKALLVDPTGSLRSWTHESTSTLCKNWQGITCDSYTSSVVVEINLSYKNLSGHLSPAIGSLISLQVLNISYNMLAGPLPSQIVGCKSLRSLDLSNNNFSGEFPFGFSQLIHLETLSLWTNSFVGHIPQELVLCSQLKHLDLGGNYLEGEIPHAIGNLSNLLSLTLAGNELSGVIPSSLGLLKKLEWLYIGYNQLNGGIPPQLGEISTLKHLDLVYNKLTGELPHALTNLTSLEYLFLYDNRLIGSIPPAIANLTKLLSLDLSSNMMSGSIPNSISNIRQLQVLNLFDNGFSGEIPRSVEVMKNLQVLALWKNNLTGEVPSKLGSLNNLTVLDLSSNQLRGHVPKHLCASKTLHNLILFSNFLSGSLPQSLGACRSLRRVRLEGNRFSGNIPSALASLPLVYYLDLSSNNFTGRLDAFAWDLPSLQVLHLQGNHLSGSIPPSLQNSKSLETLDLSQNALAGIIPLELGSLPKLNKLNLQGNKLSGTINGGFLMCKQLTDINISNNQLSGSISAELANLPSLSSLDISHNNFTGVIPPQLGDMDSLVFVNLSFNDLSGEVPESGVFIQINASAIEGNPGLCGGCSGRLCVKPSAGNAYMSGSIKEKIFTGVLFFVGLMIAMVGVGNVFWKVKQGDQQMIKVDQCMMKHKVMKKKACSEWSLTLFHESARCELSVDAIVQTVQRGKALDKMSTPTCKLLKGLTKKYVPFAALEITVSSNEKQHKISNHMRVVLGTLAKSRHPNIVDVYGICCGVTSSIMVLEPVEGCSMLKSLLRHGYHKGIAFDAERRVQVAIDVAEAIVHLHSSCSPPILHGSVSSNNVIINDKFVACLLPPNAPSCRLIAASRVDEEADDGKGGGVFAEDVQAFGELLLELAVIKSAGASKEHAEAHSEDTSSCSSETEKRVAQRALLSTGTARPAAKQVAMQASLSEISSAEGSRMMLLAMERVGQELRRAVAPTPAALRHGLKLLQGIRRRRRKPPAGGTAARPASTDAVAGLQSSSPREMH